MGPQRHAARTRWLMRVGVIDREEEEEEDRTGLHVVHLFDESQVEVIPVEELV